MIGTALLVLQAAMPGPMLGARVETILPRTPIPREGQVAVLTATSADTVYVGDQLEILTTAWFPVSVRQRLRRPPTLRPPTLNGVYSLPVVTLPGAAASRTVGETDYELFASHQVVFPLTPGTLRVPAAELSFTLPGGRPLFGEDRTDDRRSPVRTVVVLPLPATGRPGGFVGQVARDLTLRWQLGSPTMRVGESFAVDLVIAGRGNLNIWNTPAIAWPGGVRVYPDEVTATPSWQGGRLGGARRARYLLLADSVGSLRLPEVRISYFDPAVRRYREVAVGSVVIPVLPPAAVGPPRQPPGWLPARDIPWPQRILRGAPLTLLLLGLAGPVLAVAMLVVRGRRGRPDPAPMVPPLERFERLLQRACGEELAVDPRLVTQRLRRVGVPRRDAEAATALHERLRRVRYGRQADAAGEGTLSGDAAAWLSRLPARVARRYLAVFLALVAGGPAGVAAQEADPARRYADGAWDAAAAAQADAVRRHPDDATARHNLAAALWMAHRDGEAAAALLEAYRLAPRDAAIRRLWGEMARTHQQIRPLAPPLPVTPGEAMLAGLAAWILAWLGLGLGWRRAALGCGVAALMLAGGGVAVERSRARPAALVTQAVPLRLSPHGLAPVTGTVDGLAHVPVEDRQPGWVRVRDPLGRSGWVPETAVAELRQLD